jgi:hypothetical protein
LITTTASTIELSCLIPGRGTQVLDQYQPEIHCLHQASEGQAEQQRDHRQAKQQDQPPANAEPPTKPVQTAHAPLSDRR